jgi:hypothetical protein
VRERICVRECVWKLNSSELWHARRIRIDYYIDYYNSLADKFDAAYWLSASVCLSVCPPVRPSIRQSVMSRNEGRDDILRLRKEERYRRKNFQRYSEGN